ncbi:MAG TPA: PaaI family thioesterase [Allosphingosinicella sp.]
MDRIAGMTGLEVLRAIAAGELPGPGMGQTLGFRLAEVDEGKAVFEGTPGPHLLNPLGAVHGGFALALIDSACGCALHSALGPGTGYTSVETKVNFTRPIAPDGHAVRCEGRLLSRGRTIATAEAYLRSADGKLLAHGTSTLIILPPRR